MRTRRTILVALVAALVVALAPMTAPASAARPRGVVVLGPTPPDECRIGFECLAFRVTCAAGVPVAPLTGSFAISTRAAQLRGIVVAFGGGGGLDHWLTGDGGRTVLKPLLRAGFEVISVAWDSEWSIGGSGLVDLACRPAAVLQWASARYAAAGIPPPDSLGMCGLCVMGYSFGTSQVTGALSFYDVADGVEAAIVVSGPPTANIVAGCRRDGTVFQYGENTGNLVRRRIDDSYDNADPEVGPCSRLPADETTAPAWRASSLLESDQLLFPTTRFHFIWGDRDDTGAAGQGIAYLAALQAAGSPLLSYLCADSGHNVFEREESRLNAVAAVLWEPADGLNVPPVPPAALDSRCGLTAPPPA